MPVVLEGDVVTTAESATGWNNGGVESELFYQGSGCIGSKVGSGLSRFFYTGTAKDFTAGGANDGDHIIVLFGSLTPGKLDIKANGGISVAIGRNVTVTLMEHGVFYVDGSDTKPTTTLFLPYIVDPAADFDLVGGGGSYTTTGNPAQLNDAQSFGITVEATSGIMGNFNNTLVDQITIGKGLVGTGSVAFQDFIDSDEGNTANRWGWVTTRGGVLFMLGRFFVGDSSTAGDLVDSGRTIVFPETPAAAGLTGFLLDNANSVMDLSVCSLSGAGTREFFIDSTLGTLTLDTVPLTKCSNVKVNVNTSLTGCPFSESGSVELSAAATLTGCSFSNATGPSLLVTAADGLASVSGCSFNGAGVTQHAIQFDVAGTFDIDNHSFVNYGLDGSTNAVVFNNSGGHLDLNLLGDISLSDVTVLNGAGGTTNKIKSSSLTLTGLENPTEVRVFEAGTTVEVAGQETVVSGTFSAGLNVGSVDVSILSLSFQNLRLKSVNMSGDVSIPVDQLSDRQYLNP